MHDGRKEAVEIQIEFFNCFWLPHCAQSLGRRIRTKEEHLSQAAAAKYRSTPISASFLPCATSTASSAAKQRTGLSRQATAKWCTKADCNGT
jgi:hypothetical protein